MFAEDKSKYVYTASIKTGVPIISNVGEYRIVNQDSIGLSIKLDQIEDIVSYSFPKYIKTLSNPKLVINGNEIINMRPTYGIITETIYLSSAERRAVRNNEAYLICDNGNNQIKESLYKTKISIL